MWLSFAILTALAGPSLTAVAPSTRLGTSTVDPLTAEIGSKLANLRNTSTALDQWQAMGRILAHYTSIGINLINPLVAEASFASGIGVECMQALTAMATAAKAQQSWPFRMLDSSGRVWPSGLMDGTITSLGNYDKCLDISAASAGNALMSGQYCLLRWRLPVPPAPRPLTLQTRVVNMSGTALQGKALDYASEFASGFYDRYGRTGLCVPSSCHTQDIQKLADYYIHETGLTAEVASCKTKATQHNSVPWYTWIIVLVVSKLLLQVVIATVIDVILYFMKCRPTNIVLNKIVRYYDHFSLKTNFIDLVSKSKKPSFESMNGLKAISLAWIIYTHTYLVPIKETFKNVTDYMKAVEGLGFQLIVNGWVIVDTFYMLTAALAVYSIMYAMSKSGGKWSWISSVLNRIARLLPVLWFTLACVFILNHLGNGPLWGEYWTREVKNCDANVVHSMFFMSNWISAEHICYLPSWYAACDMQLYLMAPIVALLFFKWPQQTAWTLLAIAAGSSLAVGIKIAALHQLPTVMYNTPLQSAVFEATTEVYMPTYIHLSSYCVGLILGAFLYRASTVAHPLEFSPIVNIIFWMLSIAVMIVVLLITTPWNRGYEMTPLTAGLYGGGHRFLWSVAVSWITFSCVSGNAGPIDRFLAWSPFAVLAKLSYSLYLVHFLLIWSRNASARDTLPFSHLSQFYEFVVNYVLSVVFAGVVHLTIELPFARLYRAWSHGRFQWSYVTIEGHKWTKRTAHPQQKRRDRNHHSLKAAGSIQKLSFEMHIASPQGDDSLVQRHSMPPQSTFGVHPSTNMSISKF